MRLSKAGFPVRVNSDLRLRFEAKGLTSFAGLELIRRYFKSIDLAGRIRRHLGSVGVEGDYGVVAMVLLVLGLLICGGRRMQHLLYLKDDPLVLRLAGLTRLPTPRTLGRWLRRFRQEHVSRLLRINDDLVADAIRHAGLRRLTLDVDGTVISTGLKTQWAFRGFNPHHRKVPSYYPVTAYEAQTGQIVRVRNRPGNIHDGKASLGFLRDVFAQVNRTLGRGYLLEFRMDSAFFRKDVLRLLERHGAEYAIKIPFYTWIGLKDIIHRRKRWKRIDGQVSCFTATIRLEPWNRSMRVVVYRKRVFHRSRKNFQLDLFDPTDGYFEYSAIATNKSLNGRHLWAFLNGRGTHEKAYAELKNGFAFDTVPSHHYGANCAWQALSVMAHNLIKSFQVKTTAARRSATRKRRARYGLQSIQTLRYKWINRAGILRYPDGYATLDVGNAAETRKHFAEIDVGLRRAA
jgi:hypothetical protein